MKHLRTITYVILLLSIFLCGCSSSKEAAAADVVFTQTAEAAPIQTVDADAAALVLNIPTTQYFTDEAVAPQDIDTILLAGSNAPSAMNGQPWHFSAITDPAVIAEIAGGMSFGGVPAGMPEGMEAPESMAQMPEGMEKPENMGQMPEGFTPPQGADAPSGMPEMPEGAMPEGMPNGDMPTPPTGGGAKAGVEDAPLVIVISCKPGSELDAGLACQNMSVEAQLLGYGTKIVSAPTMAINAEGKEALRATLGMPEGYTACALLLVGKADTTVDTTADTYTGATQRNALEEMVTYLNP